MNLIVIGVNHQTAPVEVREQFAISEARLPEAVKLLASQPGMEEAMIVSTCNRVELVARATDSNADLAQLPAASCMASTPRPIASISTSTASATPCATCFAWLPAWTRWWWASRRFWAR